MDASMKTAEKQYIFRRVDTDELIKLPFSAVLDQDRMGFVTLPDGVQAKRCVSLEQEHSKPKKQVPVTIDRDLTMSLGFSQKQLKDMEADRVKHGFTGIEFVADPQLPEKMVGIKCGSEKERERYIKHRGYFNQTGRISRALTAEDLETAKRLVLERHG